MDPLPPSPAHLAAAADGDPLFPGPRDQGQPLPGIPAPRSGADTGGSKSVDASPPLNGGGYSPMTGADVADPADGCKTFAHRSTNCFRLLEALKGKVTRQTPDKAAPRRPPAVSRSDPQPRTFKIGLPLGHGRKSGRAIAGHPPATAAIRTGWPVATAAPCPRVLSGSARLSGRMQGARGARPASGWAQTCSSSTSVPQKSFGWRNSTGLPWAPIFGSPEPITRAPWAFSWSRAAMMSSTS